MPTASTSATSPTGTVNVAFLGPLGTYSHQATSDFFGAVELIPVARIADVFEAVASSSVTYGLVPIENSSIGSVTETIDELRTTTLVVRHMIPLRIGHALLGVKDRKGKAKRVYSHEQGIGQCVGYLKRNHPAAEVVPVNSTAEAARLAAKDDDALAICSIKCAEVYGLEVIDRDIQDGGALNTTRFVVISRPDVPLAAEFPVFLPIPPSITVPNGDKPITVLKADVVASDPGLEV